MESTKFIGMDVHKETISIAVMTSTGKLVMESIIETKAITIVQLIQGLRGELNVTFEEGTWAAWFYDLLKPHVTKQHQWREGVYDEIQEMMLLQGSLSIERMCQLAGVSRAGFYRSLQDRAPVREVLHSTGAITGPIHRFKTSNVDVAMAQLLLGIPAKIIGVPG